MRTPWHEPIIYVSDSEPGIRRRRAGNHFVYLDPSGRRVRVAEVLARIRQLAVPPAYRDVWICRECGESVLHEWRAS